MKKTLLLLYLVTLLRGNYAKNIYGWAAMLPIAA